MDDTDDPHLVVRDPNFWSALLGEPDAEHVDFYESVEGAPYMYFLGKIVLDFSYAEQQLKALLWTYLGDSFEGGHAITAAMGTNTATKLLMDSAERASEVPEIIDLISFATKAFEVCRNNRNALAHSMNVEEGNEECTSVWIRASRRLGAQQTQMIVSPSDMARVSMEIARTAFFLVKLNCYKIGQKNSEIPRTELPEKFVLPQRLKSKDVNLKHELEKLGLSDLSSSI